jgi:hypothetical protein
LTRGNIGRNKIKKQTGKRKILLIGDSHLKGLSSELKHNSTDTCGDILGIVKPNSIAIELVRTNIQEVNKLMQKDILVLLGRNK